MTLSAEVWMTANAVAPLGGAEDRLAREYGRAARRLGDLSRLRSLFGAQGADRVEARRQLRGVHAAALRTAAVAVHGPGALDPGTGLPRRADVPPCAEVGLLWSLAEPLGVAPADVRSCVCAQSPDAVSRAVAGVRT